MSRRVAPPTRAHQIGPLQDVADGARRRPLDVRMQFGQTDDNLTRPHMGKTPAESDDLGGDIVRCPMRDVDRRARPILQPGSAVGIVARQPLVSNAAADAVAGRQLGDGVEPAEVGLDESHPFVHRTGLLPWHDTPSLHVG